MQYAIRLLLKLLNTALCWTSSCDVTWSLFLSPRDAVQLVPRRSLYNWRYPLFMPMGGREREARRAAAMAAGACRWMFARLTWQRWGPAYHRTGRRMSADFLAAAAAAAVVMVLQTVELCSHAPQQRLSSVRTRAAAPAPRHRRFCGHQLAALFSRPRRAPWRQNGHLLLDRKSFTLSTYRPATRRHIASLPCAFLHINAVLQAAVITNKQHAYAVS